jgi:hypothetical protein
MGALTFGNISNHQLPHSRLMVRLPINFGLFPDQVFREAKGLSPDLWVPAEDAVNYAVAAVRSGTISTAQPLPASTLQKPLDLENPRARELRKQAVSILVIALMVVAGATWAYFVRKRPRIVAVVGGVWLVFGIIRLVTKKPPDPLGVGFFAAGGVCLVWGALNLWRTRGRP